MEEVDEANVSAGDDAGDASEELEIEFDEEDAPSVLVGRKTPL